MAVRRLDNKTGGCGRNSAAGHYLDQDIIVLVGCRRRNRSGDEAQRESALPQGTALSKHLDEDADICRTITPKP